MIVSILDNDLYKFTMQNAVMKLYPNAKVEYQFFNRGKDKFPIGFAEKLKEKIIEIAKLRLADDEEKFLLEKCYYLDPVYVDFLKGYRFNPDEVKVYQHNGNLSLQVEGYWYRTILWEVPLLATISELFFKLKNDTKIDVKKLHKLNARKANNFEKLKVKIAEFGTRRRYSFENQYNVVKTLKEFAPNNLIGTSNVYIAFKEKLTPIGTQAHEWFMFHAAKYGFKMANSISLGRWVDVYHGNLGTALSDTFTSEAFFDSFDTMYAKLFDGVRQDSGDPIKFAHDLINHYKKLRINPKLKTIVFSDSLDLNKVKKIEKEVSPLINTSYGIGTFLSNDIPGIKPLNIVIKMVSAAPNGKDWIETIKLSDIEGKHTGNKKVIRLAKQLLELTSGNSKK